jgi:hypothetical protein
VYVKYGESTGGQFEVARVQCRGFAAAVSRQHLLFPEPNCAYFSERLKKIARLSNIEQTQWDPWQGTGVAGLKYGVPGVLA